MGIIQSLHNAANRGVKIKVLTPTDEKIVPKMEAVLQDKNNNMGIRRVRYKSEAETSEEARTKILVVDRKAYLVVELKDDSKETFVEAVRLAIHSTTQSTVKSYITLFESLWEQSELYDKLEAHDKMQREFINVAAHELKTPIQPILISIELLEQEFRNGKEEVMITKEDLSLLFRNAKRLERLSSAILEVTRIEGNSMRLNKEKFDINEKIGNVINDVKGLSPPDKKLEIINDTRDSIFVKADKLRIFEVISNLVRNAIKFTNEGRIVVKGQREGNNLLVQVKDTGTGIDPDIKPRLFTKFATKSDQGTGLGLFISKSIVEAHGGRIWAEDNPDGRGATFSFTLPLA